MQLDLPDAPVVCLDFWCRAGSAFEQVEESGMAHFLEHMVFKGSTQLAAGEFDRRIEALGGSSNAATMAMMAMTTSSSINVKPAA